MEGKKSLQKEIKDSEVAQLIREEGIEFDVPRWIKFHPKKGPSVLVLADSQLKFWPEKDNICKVIFHKKWLLRRWSQAIRLGLIRIESYRVVLYLEASRSWQDVSPGKNSLTVLCKTIHYHGNNPMIFISNHLPRVGASPVHYPVAHSNFTLQQTIRSTSRALKGRVFEMSLCEHFTTKEGKVIKPRDQVFLGSDDKLTVYGCLIFRECLMREVGIKLYWFD